MSHGLSEKQLAEINSVLAQYPEVERGVLFGSRAMDSHEKASDVDIAIEGDAADRSLAASIKTHFEYDTYLPYFFDIVARPTITSEALENHIQKHGVVIYRKNAD